MQEVWAPSVPRAPVRAVGRRESPVTIALVLLLACTPAVSVTAAGWADRLELLGFFAAAGVLFALLLSRLIRPAALAHLLALLFGAALVTAYFATLAPRGGGWQGRLAWLWERLRTWWEVAVSGGASSDTLLFAITVALLAWFLGYASGWFVFRERSPWWAILPNGCAILLNLSYSPPELLIYLIIFLLAAMLLLVDITQQRARAAARAHGAASPDATPSVLLAATVLSAGLLGLAWVLPSGGISQRVADWWYTASAPWQPLQATFDRLFAALNAPERAGRGLNFGRTLAPRAAFELGEQPVLAIAAREPRYWRAATYDRYTGQLFVSSDPSTLQLGAEQTRPPDSEPYEARVEFEQRVQLLAPQTNMLFAADAPVRVSVPAYYDYREVPDDFASLRLQTPLRRGQQYTVVSMVSVATVSDLRAAGTDYPAWTRRYRELPRSLPIRVRQEAARITAGATNAYDKAVALESYLRQFRYSTRVKQPPPDRDWVDYMLFETREGYCDYFAAAMTVMLRAVGIPARVASGFAPGERDASQDLIIVRESHAHSWTEAYFPGYGWITFEPSALRPIPPRLESFGLDGSLFGDLFGFEDEDYSLYDLEGLSDISATNATGAAAENQAGPGLLQLIVPALLAVAVVLLVGLVAGALLLLLWQHNLRSLRPHVRPYAQLSAFAAWAGLRRRPSDTPYEYAATLSRAVPPARSQVQTITEAYVRGTYGRGPLDHELARRAVEAWATLRWLLLRRALQRWRRLPVQWRRGDER